LKQERKSISPFASRLRSIMEARKLTQQQVADEIKVSRITVVKWSKTSIPRSAELFKLAKFLGVTPEFLLDEGKDILDFNLKPTIVGDVKRLVPTWEELKRDVIRLTAKQGQKKSLADELKVTRQVLGNWLSDDDQGKPDAVNTLKLLKWVEEHPLR
jgi:transcriptional regulator with XRE-family HTH domain